MMSLPVSWRAMAFALGALAAAATPLSTQAREMRGWNVHVDDYPVSLGMKQFATAVSDVTKGRHSAKVYNNAQLGPQTTALQQLITGEIDFAEVGVVGYGDKVPSLQILGTPYMFHNSTHMFNLLDGALGDLFATELAKQGVIVLGWYDGGTRNFFHKTKAMPRLSDFKDAKLRVGHSKTGIALIKALTAEPVPLNGGEVIPAFESGKIDGAENNIPFYESSGQYKLAPHYTFTQHWIVPEVLIMSKKTWDELSPIEQKQMREAGRKSALYMRQEWAKRINESRARLEKQGVKFYQGGDYGPFVRAMKPLFEDLWRSKDPVSTQALHLVLNSGS